MLERINLSLSSTCGANCIYCPSNRGKRIKEKIMPFSTVKKIIDEISSEEFKKSHNIKHMEIGENGDAFLNKDLIKILSYIKMKLPKIKIEIFTNFQNFDKDKAEIILKNRLIDSFWCNIDGSTPENYYYVKKIDLKNIMVNLSDFIQIRKKLNIDVPLTVLVLTLHNYIHIICNNLGFYPFKVNNSNLARIPDDFFIVKKQLEDILNMKKDKIFKSSVGGWAEREKVNVKKIRYKKFYCSNLHRIKTEVFIAPDGTWYACCLDSNNELVLGNIKEQSINEIYFSDKRKQLIELLSKKQFKKIGGPCKTVNCCQNLYLTDKTIKGRILIIIKFIIKKLKIDQRIKMLIEKYFHRTN